MSTNAIPGPRVAIVTGGASGVVWPPSNTCWPQAIASLRWIAMPRDWPGSPPMRLGPG